VIALASTKAAAPFLFTVTALDASNNVVTNYTGTVKFASTDAQAPLSDNVTFTLNNNGVVTVAGILATAGSRTLTATDVANSSISGTSGPITVTPGAATHFTLTAPPTAV